MSNEDAERFIERNVHDRRNNGEPLSSESGLTLREELKAGGILSGEDKENYLIHYGDTNDFHILRNYATGESDMVYCDAPHNSPNEDCFECGWNGPFPKADRWGEHNCPACGESMW